MTRNQAGDPALPLPGLDAIGPFFFQNLTTNGAKLVFTTGVAACTAVTMPGKGSLLGLSVNLDEAPAAGTYGIRVVKNNTNVGGVFAFTGASTQTLTRFTDNMTSVMFDRGDTFKIWGSSSATLTTTRDAVVYLWVAA